MDWELAAFAIWCFTFAVVGGTAGLVLGNIRLPATLLLASSPASGAAANIAISAIAAGAASITHIKAGRVNWRLVAWMGPPSIVGGLVGGYLAGSISSRALLILIAAVLVYSAVDLTFRPLRKRGDNESANNGLNLQAAVVSGGIIGVLGGMVGLILGSLRIPAIIRLVGESPERTIGTNQIVGLMLGAAAVVGHLSSSPPDLVLILVGGAASIPGALIGARLTGKLSEKSLMRFIALILVVAAVAALVSATR